MCVKKLLFFIGAALLLSVGSSYAQPSVDRVWSLQRCVEYALEHNISIKQNVLTSRLSKYNLQQSQLSQLPTLSTNSSFGRSFGRSINPTTNQFVDAGYNFNSISGNSNVLLFGWMQVRNTIAQNKYQLQAALADLDQLHDDVSLNVATGFLTALLAQEQIRISQNQVGLSQARLDQTRAFAAAGRLPELDVAQLESQVATDSSNLIAAIANFNSSVLDLKTLLNLDFNTPFEIQPPAVSVGDQLTVSTLLPEEVFQKARLHFGAIKGSEYRVQAAQKGVMAAKANLLPQLSMGYQIGTNWASNFQSVQYTPDGLQLSGVAYDTITNRTYNVYQPGFKMVASDIPFGKQLNNNLRQSVFATVNIPIFNSWQAQLAVRQAKINLQQQELTQYTSELNLKQNVYKAHNNALNSIQKYNAAKHAQEAAARALDFAKKRYELGLTTTVELLVTQNNDFAAAANLISAKYDLIFKLKVVDYYLGKELKL